MRASSSVEGSNVVHSAPLLPSGDDAPDPVPKDTGGTSAVGQPTLTEMWVPRNEEELLTAIERGGLQETASLDLKRELPKPGRNKELARDICAMTVDGGVLLYGVDEREGHAPELTPIELAGAKERIDLVSRTAISEPPSIEVFEIPAAAKSGRGYLAVRVPASPQAPHMVTLQGENRFYGRGAAGNTPLSAGEVARLYAQRERWEIDGATLLDTAVAEMPFDYEDPLDRIGPMVVVCRPVASGAGLLRQAAGDETIKHFITDTLRGVAKANDPDPSRRYGLNTAFNLRRVGADIFRAAEDFEFQRPYQHLLQLNERGDLTYWASPTVSFDPRIEEPVFNLMEGAVTRGVHQALAVAGALFSKGGYYGAVDCGVAILSIAEAYGASLNRLWLDRRSPFGAPEYRRVRRVITSDLTEHTEETCRSLVEPLFEVISTPDFDPYARE